MRIVAGKFRSRTLDTLPGDATRPTADKIKEAVFSRIGPYFVGGEMLDLFGGSGNIGLEALSRGMGHIVFVDSSKEACQIITQNAKKLKVEEAIEVLWMDYHKGIKKLAQERRCFDLVYLDPPYKNNQLHQILGLLSEYSLIQPGGKVVCESLKEDIFQEAYQDIIKTKESMYGITKITIYERTIV